MKRIAFAKVLISSLVAIVGLVSPLVFAPSAQAQTSCGNFSVNPTTGVDPAQGTQITISNAVYDGTVIGSSGDNRTFYLAKGNRDGGRFDVQDSDSSLFVNGNLNFTLIQSNNGDKFFQGPATYDLRLYHYSGGFTDQLVCEFDGEIEVLANLACRSHEVVPATGDGNFTINIAGCDLSDGKNSFRAVFPEHTEDFTADASGRFVINTDPSFFTDKSIPDEGDYEVNIYKLDGNLATEHYSFTVSIEEPAEILCGDLVANELSCPSGCGGPTKVGANSFVCRPAQGFFGCSASLIDGSTIYPGQTKDVQVGSFRLPDVLLGTPYRRIEARYNNQSTNNSLIPDNFGGNILFRIPNSATNTPGTNEPVEIYFVGDGTSDISVGPICQTPNNLNVSEEKCFPSSAAITLNEAQNQFFVAFSISTASLYPNRQYDILLDSQTGQVVRSFTTSATPATDTVDIVFGPNDPEINFTWNPYAGQTHNLLVERVSTANEGNSDTACEIPLNFPEDPTELPISDIPPTPPPPPEVGEPGETLPLADLCFQAGKFYDECKSCNGIWTAVGCIPASDRGIATSLARLLIGLSGGIAIAVILVGSVIIASSQNNPQQRQTGNELVTSAVFGLIFIILSVVILRFIGVDILALPGFN